MRLPVCRAQLGFRFSHVLRRMLPIAMHLLQRDGQFLNGHDLFLRRVGAAYHAFLEVSIGPETTLLQPKASKTLKNPQSGTPPPPLPRG